MTAPGRFARAWLAVATMGVAIGAVAGGCREEAARAPRGAPVLRKMFWGAERVVVWSREVDAQLQPSVSPSVIGFELSFDGKLDGDKIEDTVRVDGGVTTRPSTTPPLRVTWGDNVDLPPGQFSLTVGYNSLPLPREPVGTVYIFGRVTPAFPSQTTLTIHLDKSRLTSVYDEPMEGLDGDTITVRTTPFSVVVAAPSRCADGTPGPVATDYALPLVFSNRPTDDGATVSSFVRITAVGQEVPFRLISDARSPVTLYAAPATESGRWPAGVLDVAVTAGLPDLFGVGLYEGASGQLTAVETIGPSGLRCPAVPDGGAADGGVDGGEIDGGDDVDAGPDAATDADQADDDAGDAGGAADQPG